MSGMVTSPVYIWNMDVTINLMTGNQSKVWESVHRYTTGSREADTIPTPSSIANSQISESGKIMRINWEKNI